MPQWLVARQTGERQARETLGDLHADGALIDTAGLIGAGLAPVVGTVIRQAVGNPHQGRPDPPIRLPDDRSPVTVGLITLGA